MGTISLSTGVYRAFRSEQGLVNLAFELRRKNGITEVINSNTGGANDASDQELCLSPVFELRCVILSRSVPGHHHSKGLRQLHPANANPLSVRIHKGRWRPSPQLDHAEELRPMQFLLGPLSVRFALSRG
jgi:hypothetical protein